MNTDHMFLKEINEQMYEAIACSISAGSRRAYAEYDLGCGYIDISTGTDDMPEVEVVNTDSGKRTRRYPNVAAAVREAVPLWGDVMEDLEGQSDSVWQLNGFADEQDYLRYRYG